MIIHMKGLLKRSGVYVYRNVMSEEMHDAITGHSHASIGRQYGRGVSLKTIGDAMAKVSFAGITSAIERG